jgi:hypothetical protein
MKNYLNPFAPIKIILLLSFVLSFFPSCKKESPVSTTLEKSEVIQNKTFVPEKVDAGLLNTYINYQTKVEAISMLKKAGKNIESLAPKMEIKEFDLMIENYLANERNMILSKAFIKNQSAHLLSFRSPWDDGGDDLPVGDDGTGNSGPFTGTGHFPGSTITNIIFTGNLSNIGVISGQAFSFGGVHGTIAQTGSISQAVYNGVTTYQQNFSETYNLPGGVVYVQNFVVYGNIYGSTVTVTGMSLP